MQLAVQLAVEVAVLLAAQLTVQLAFPAGRNCGQAPGQDSEVMLRPCAIYPDPFRGGENILVHNFVHERMIFFFFSCFDGCECVLQI